MSAKTLVASFILCLTLGLASPGYADDKADAGTFADDLGHKALAVITDTSASKEQRRTQLEGLFQEYVDIDWIAKFVLGRFWRDATPAQQQQYMANYRTFIIKHYTSNLTEFTDANFEISKISDDGQGGFDVTVRLKRPNADDMVIDYTVRKTAGTFKIYDIIVEGVSLITTQRSEFSSVASQKGLDYLIAQLAARSKNEAGDTASAPAAQ